MSIEMGNDEFILYIRKVYPNCPTSNDTLGRLIWKRLKDLDPAALIIHGRDSFEVFGDWLSLSPYYCRESLCYYSA